MPPLDRALAALRIHAPDGFLVGGCVRDWLMGRPLKDLDVAVPALSSPPEGPEQAPADASGGARVEAPPLSERVRQVGETLAAELCGSFFWLREGMGVARIVVPDDEPLQVDVVPLAGSLEADLRRRDFTINAMAIRTSDGFHAAAAILDPTGGRRDLERSLLRLAAPGALQEDPLRCLRAFRFRATLGLSFDPDLPSMIQVAAPGLSRVSGERIRDELFVLLESSRTADVMADLLDMGLVSPWCVPLAESAAGHPSARQQAAGIVASGLDVVRALDTFLTAEAVRQSAWNDLAATLGSRVTPPRSRTALTRLAALAIGAGMKVTEIAGALALSSEETRVVRRAVGGANALQQAVPGSGSERLRFFQQWEPGAVEAVLLAIAALRVGSKPRTAAAVQPTTSLEALLSDLLERRLRPRPPLLTGDVVMELLGLPPGPEVGRCLQAIEERRADGLLQSADDAIDWLRQRQRPPGGAGP
jgi:poly(A) polymerase